MYRCEDCLRITEPGQPQQLIAETRDVDHPKRERAHRHRGKWKDDPGGPGTQIARERRVCADCHAKARALDRRPVEPVAVVIADVVPDVYGLTSRTAPSPAPP